MKDYSKQMHANEDGGYKTDGDRHISIGNVEAYIHKACAEAIADTKRTERARAVRIVMTYANSGCDDPDNIPIVNEILGKEPYHGSR